MYSKKIIAFLKKNNASVNDFVRIKKGGQIFNGTLLNRPDYLKQETLILKLESGYNIGVNLRNVDEIIVVKKAGKIKEKPAKKLKLKKGFISVLHTGGTIASKVDYRTGGVVSRFSPEELIGMFPKLQKYGPINSVFMGNMFSDDMRFEHYRKMAEFIKKEINNGSRGIIITHGTDTLAYSSAALSFILENVPVPVILAGAQRSSDRPSSDAEMNLVCAAKFIRNSEFRGVCVCMHDSMNDDACAIFQGVNVKKLHSSRRDAFKQINDDLIAIVEYMDDDITFFKEYEKKKEAKGKFEVLPKMEPKVAILKIHTNMFAEQFAFYREKKYKGLIIEGTGLGHCPITRMDSTTAEHAKIRLEIEALILGGCTVAMCSQTINGRVNMNVYSPGRDLINMGVISAETMTSETAFAKLAWLIANYPKNVEELMAKDLRGEIKKRVIK
ncbi:MAG: Glu-tRNA(Gln) amidotransferase subunit GatD [Candidatus Nanoarchaeia archaeon]|nr:Glu-tRNA(Gln) amidotransferase subunit GatD [Candidatus Nanoarchaeia archaeon]